MTSHVHITTSMLISNANDEHDAIRSDDHGVMVTCKAKKLGKFDATFDAKDCSLTPYRWEQDTTRGLDVIWTNTRKDTLTEGRQKRTRYDAIHGKRDVETTGYWIGGPEHVRPRGAGSSFPVDAAMKKGNDSRREETAERVGCVEQEIAKV